MRYRNQGLMTAIGFILLVFSTRVFCQAEIPFFSADFADPDVLLLLDTSGSMTQHPDCNSFGGACTAIDGGRRIDIIDQVMTGGEMYITYEEMPVYKGDPLGENSVYKDLINKGVLVEIVLVKKEADNEYRILELSDYSPSDPDVYFYPKDPVDLGSSTVERATYDLSSYMRDHNADSLGQSSPQDVIGDRTSNVRLLWQAGGEYPYNSKFLEWYGLLDDSQVFMVEYIDKCYCTGTYDPKKGLCKQGGWEPCYNPFDLLPYYSVFPPLPLPAGKQLYFVKFGYEDQQRLFEIDPATGEPSPIFKASLGGELKLSMVLSYADLNLDGWPDGDDVTDKYKMIDQRSVCGDGNLWMYVCTGTPIPSNWLYDGLDINRPIFIPLPRNTKDKDAQTFISHWTNESVATNIMNAIPMVEEVDAVGGGTDGTEPDGKIGPEFIKRNPNIREDISVRKGLGFSDAEAQKTLTASDISSPYFGNFFNDKNGNFNGLTYKKLTKITEEGIIQHFSEFRWGFMTFDCANCTQSGASGSKEKDWQCAGGNLQHNFSNEPEDTALLLARFHQLTREDETEPQGPDYLTCQEPTCYPQGYGQLAHNNTPLASAVRDAFSYFFGPDSTYAPASIYLDPDCRNTQFSQADNLTCTLDPVTCETRRYPSMFRNANNQPHWENRPEYKLSTYHDGHIVLDDPYFAHKCRRLFVIIISDGAQTCGEGGGGGNVDQIMAVQQHYVNALKNNDVKVFVIGFALGADPKNFHNAYEQLQGMAEASKLNEEDEFDYVLLANNKEELKRVLTQVGNAIREGSYTRSVPVINAQGNMVAGGYFDIVASDYMWRGHFFAINYLPKEIVGSTVIQGTAENSIDAAYLLNDRNSDGRDIFTALPDGDGRYGWSKLDFVEDNADDLMTLDADSVPYLNPGDQNHDSIVDVNDARILISFIRGDWGSTYLDGSPRVWKLGAIYHSKPIVVLPPGGYRASEKVDPKYNAFAQRYSTRPQIAYVGANDGMMHAFFFEDPDGDGPRSVLEEAFAYIPKAIMNKLHYLREGTQYIYVDGDITGAEMKVYWPNGLEPNVPPNNDPTGFCNKDETIEKNNWCWRTILFGGLGDGGNWYFSLDVTDADTTSAEQTSEPAPNIEVRWEVTQSGLARTWSKPTIGEILGYDEAADAAESYAALVFGGGLDDPLKRTPYNGSWVFVINADNKDLLKAFMIPDRDMKCDPVIDDPVEDCPDNQYGYPVHENFNQVPSSVLLVDSDMNLFVDRAYVGDYQGRVWKINFQAHKSENKSGAEAYNRDYWHVCLFYDDADLEGKCKSDLSNYPSCIDRDKARPIFYRPDSVRLDDGTRLVYFGTGNIDDKSEALIENINHVFAIWDKDSGDECNYGTLWDGWTINPIPMDKGEKIVVAPLAFGGGVNFYSFNPLHQANICSIGTTFYWSVHTTTGVGLLANNAMKEIAPAPVGGWAMTSEGYLVNIKLPTKPGEPGGFEFKPKPFEPLGQFYYFRIVR